MTKNRTRKSNFLAVFTQNQLNNGPRLTVLEFNTSKFLDK